MTPSLQVLFVFINAAPFVQCQVEKSKKKCVHFDQTYYNTSLYMAVQFSYALTSANTDKVKMLFIFERA